MLVVDKHDKCDLKSVVGEGRRGKVNLKFKDIFATESTEPTEKD